MRQAARALLALLTGQRWFGAAGRTIADATLEAEAPVPGAPGCTLACVRVRFADGAQVLYQVPIATNGDEMRDASTVPEFRRALGRAFADQSMINGPNSRWQFEAISPLTNLGDAPTHINNGEQSNTSIIYGDGKILKMFRRLEPGPHPDVEIGRFLTTRTDFRGTPTLRGVLHLHTAAGTCVAGMVQEFLPDAVDGWDHVLARLRACSDELTAELTALGAATRELHAALASDPDDPDFAPEPTGTADLERWRAATRTQIQATLGQLAERRDDLPAAVQPAIDELLANQSQLARLTEQPLSQAQSSTLGPRIRHHGDYHLGQVLRTGDGWRIIDFEGEPNRPLAERRAKHHPLRDVAGMLRSFGYAAAVAAPSCSEAASRTMRTAFLAGYDPDTTKLADAGRAGLLALFTAEKLFYELSYELGSRPDWLWIPLSAVPDLLASQPWQR